jgi:hypothetical protein
MNDAIGRYLKGELRIAEAAKLVHVSAGRFKAAMAERGLSHRSPSEGQALRHARDPEWSRSFREAGRAEREKWVTSDRNRARMSALGAKQGKSNRGRIADQQSVNRRAESHERALLKVSPLALDFQKMLTERGVDTVLEKAAGRYNIDIAIGDTIAVEVHRYSFNPLGPTRIRERHRTRQLCDAGWLVCYVWARPTDSFRLDASAADYVVTLEQLAESNPSMRGEYRVIRSTGQLLTAGRGDGNELA